MPWGDGTGPWWAQGRWRCWRAYGYARPFRPFAVPQPTRNEEIRMLEDELKALKQEIEEITKRLKELKG